MNGHAVAGVTATPVPRELRACLHRELENLRRLLHYRGLERRFAAEMRAAEDAIRAALEAGSRPLTLSALRGLGALMTEVSSAPVRPLPPEARPDLPPPADLGGGATPRPKGTRERHP